MATKKSQHRSPRLPFRAAPLAWPAFLAIFGGLVLIGMGWVSRGQGITTQAVWTIFGIFLIAYPLLSFVAGNGSSLRVGLRQLNLQKLSKVTVFHTKNFGITTPVAVLISPDQVKHVSGLFLTKKDFARMVGWFGVPVEKIDGIWSTNSLLATRTDLKER